MASERQRQANRQNARSSTGPRSTGGKARSAQNARRHGLSGSGTDGDAALALYRLFCADPSAQTPARTDGARAQETWTLACIEARRQAAGAAVAQCEAALEALIAEGAFAQTPRERAAAEILKALGITRESPEALRAAVQAKLVVMGPLQAVDPVATLLHRRRLLLRYRTEAEAARSRCLTRLIAVAAE